MHRLFFVLILLSLTCGSYAAEVDNLYQAQSAIASHDEQERDKLTPQLLQQVMLKVVGNSELLNSKDIAPILAKADQYVQQYEYQRTNVIRADLTQPDQLVLKLRFDSDGVNRAIRGLGLPIWGKIRPDILVWMAVKQNQKSYLLGLENTDANMTAVLQDSADKRGLPVLLPLMDLQDQTQIDVNAIWQQDNASVQSASQRYGADILLIVQVTVEAEVAQVTWQAVINDEIKRWQSQGGIEAAMDAGMGQLADILASQYAQPVDNNQTQQRLTMHISDVMDYSDFTRLMAYLRQLDYISDIRVINLNQHKLDLDIAFSGNLQILQRTLAVGRMLAEKNSFDGNGAQHYRLLP